MEQDCPMSYCSRSTGLRLQKIVLGHIRLEHDVGCCTVYFCLSDSEAIKC